MRYQIGMEKVDTLQNLIIQMEGKEILRKTKNKK